MTQEEILEYNRRCAEFLEYDYDDISETYETSHLKLVEPQAFGDEQFSCKLKDYELDFHSDWNWIMEILNKVSSLDFGWKVTSKYVNIYSHSGDPRGEFDCKFKMNCPQDVIVDTVKTINQFLIWYNENK